MSTASDKRRTRIDFSSFGGVGLRPKAGSLDQIQEEDIADTIIVPKHEAVKEPPGTRDHLTNHNALDPTTGLKRLRLVDAAGLRISEHEYIRTKHASPWDTYEELGDVRLGAKDWVTVAQRIHPLDDMSDPLANLVAVKKYSGFGVQDKLQRLQHIRHANIVSVREIFAFEGASVVIFEHMAICLSHVAGSPLLNEIKLAAVLGQILSGLAYLATEGFEHGSLTCSSIILNPYGEVKIKGQEDFHIYQPAKLQDIRALKDVTMDLMQGYRKDDGAVGVDDVVRWPLDSKAVSFLAQTTSTTSMIKLMEHPLLQLPWKKGMLAGLAFFGTIEARIGRRYPQRQRVHSMLPLEPADMA